MKSSPPNIKKFSTYGKNAYVSAAKILGAGMVEVYDDIMNSSLDDHGRNQTNTRTTRSVIVLDSAQMARDLIDVIFNHDAHERGVVVWATTPAILKNQSDPQWWAHVCQEVSTQDTHLVPVITCSPRAGVAQQALALGCSVIIDDNTRCIPALRWIATEYGGRILINIHGTKIS